MQHGGHGRLQHVCGLEHVHSNKIVSCNEPSNQMHQKCLVTIVYTMIKPMYHCDAAYKTESIYVQTKQKDQGIPELALEVRKID